MRAVGVGLVGIRTRHETSGGKHRFREVVSVVDCMLHAAHATTLRSTWRECVPTYRGIEFKNACRHGSTGVQPGARGTMPAPPCCLRWVLSPHTHTPVAELEAGVELILEGLPVNRFTTFSFSTQKAYLKALAHIIAPAQAAYMTLATRKVACVATSLAHRCQCLWGHHLGQYSP